MPADIAERPDAIVVTARDDHRGDADVDGERIAGLGHVGRDANEQPLASEEDLEIGLEHVLPQIEVRRQHVPRPARSDELPDRWPFLRRRRTIQDGRHVEPDPAREVVSRRPDEAMNRRCPDHRQRHLPAVLA